jgi:hypothetical protein
VASVGLISFVYGRPHYGSDRLRAARRLSHRARSRRRGVTNQYARENLTGKGIVVLVVLADDSEEELLPVSYLFLNGHRKRDKRERRKTRFIPSVAVDFPRVWSTPTV